MNLTKKTIYECLMEQVNKAPDSVALEYENEFFSWKDIDLFSNSAAIIFEKMGIRKGSHVGIWSVNSPNWIFTFFALIKLGAIPILINTCYKETELARVLEYADIEFLCYGYGYRDVKYEDVLNNISSKFLPNKEKRISIDKSKDGKWKGIKDKFVDVSKDDLKRLSNKAKEISAYDTAVILFTSGTSKVPKGVILSHYNLVNNSMELALKMHWTSSDKMCIAVPMYHCFGITASLLVSVHTGCTMNLLKYYRTIDVLNKINSQKCTILNGVPSMFLALLNNEKYKEYDISSVKSGIIAGSQISSYDYLKICNTFNIPYLQTSYGQTEASPCITISSYDDSLEIKSQTAGKKISNILLRVVDDASGKEKDTGSIGEIQTKGYHVMQGYYNMPEETKRVISNDGWLSTGDLGYLDKDGYLHITGRKTEMIIRGGENISPAEIEGCICEFPGIRYVKVIGVNAKVLQEEIAACVVSADGEKIDEEELKAFIKGKLSDYKVPKYILQFNNLPYNSSGKVILNDLKQEALDKINQIQKEDL